MNKPTFCKGCKWEFDFDKCENDYKSNMLRNKSGSLISGYCAWKNPIKKRIVYVEYQCNKCGSVNRSQIGCYIRCPNPKCKDNGNYKIRRLLEELPQNTQSGK